MLRELDPDIPEEELQGMVNEIDQDDSGTVDFDGEIVSEGSTNNPEHLVPTYVYPTGLRTRNNSSYSTYLTVGRKRLSLCQ